MSEPPITEWYYFIATPEIYPSLEGYVDASRGYPIGGSKASTLRGLPPAEDLKTTNDGNGNLMLQLETWRVNSADFTSLDPYISSGEVSVVTKSEWDALLPVEDEDLLDDLELPEDEDLLDPITETL